MEYGLIGAKLGHSFSKEIHAQIGKYDYELKEIVSTDLPAFMKQKDFKGINVTINDSTEDEITCEHIHSLRVVARYFAKKGNSRFENILLKKGVPLMRE